MRSQNLLSLRLIIKIQNYPTISEIHSSEVNYLLGVGAISFADVIFHSSVGQMFFNSHLI